jgi:hypothetical protein
VILGEELRHRVVAGYIEDDDVGADVLGVN